MPLEFIPLDKSPQLIGPKDRGFIINLTKARWSNSASTEAVKLFNNFTQMYYEHKCPDENKDQEKEEDEVDEETKLRELEELELEDGPSSKKMDKSGIEFAVRDVFYPHMGFVACNLADPADFAYFVLTKLAEKGDYKKPRLPFRILPVQRICEAKAKAVEQAVVPLLENTLAKDEFPYRFSLVYRGHSGGEYLSHDEAKSVVRNCVWALNPNCVQCIKYQDFAIVMDILDPLFVVGVAKDFQKLASYNTWIIRHGIKPQPTSDSEDEISDDPNLSDEEERKRKLRIKRKRRAERAGLTHPGGDFIKKSEKVSDGEDDNNMDEDDDEDNHGTDDVADALNDEDEHVKQQSS